MCPKVKRYKGKEMGTFWGANNEQKACLEGDTDSEGKVKKVLCNIRVAGLEAKGFHLGFLVNVVLARVAEAIFKAAGFGSQGQTRLSPAGRVLGALWKTSS